jgi:hypothetical protein
LEGWRLREGDEGGFSASLSAAVEGRDELYSDAGRFFSMTFITEGLARILAGVAKRISGSGGPHGFLVYSPPGWGKTHSLIAAYHLASNPENSLSTRSVAAALEARGAPRPEPAAVIVAFDGAALGPRDLRSEGWESLWDLILAELSGSEVRGGAEPPSLDAVASALAAAEERGGAVIIIDGLDSYASRLRASGDRRSVGEVEGLPIFLETLGEAIKGSRRTIALISVASGYTGTSIEASIAASARWAEPVSPVLPGEVPDVARARLFSAVNSDVARAVAARYAEEYKRAGVSIPRAELESSYPVHPVLAELLARLSAEASLSWALSLLRAVAEARGDGSDFILPSDVDVTERSVADRLFTVAPKLRGPVEVDARSIARLDPGRVAVRVYSALVLYSMAGRPATVKDLAAASITPLRGVDAGSVERAFNILREEAVHVHERRLRGVPALEVKSEVNVHVLIRRRAIRRPSPSSGLLQAPLPSRLRGRRPHSSSRKVSL